MYKFTQYMPSICKKKVVIVYMAPSNAEHIYQNSRVSRSDQINF